MTREEILDQITIEGNKFDGHVTNGSAAALADLFERVVKLGEVDIWDGG
jgi:hypothetical protein